MIKFLVAILLTVTVVRFIADNGPFVDKYSIAKSSAEEAEGKTESKKHESNKYDNEETFYVNYPVYYLILHPSPGAAFPIIHHMRYCSFVGKPNTPPPDATF